MKKPLCFLLLSLALVASAHAQDAAPVEIVGKEISIPADSAIVARTNKTAKEVTINLLVPMAKTVCEDYESYNVMVTSSIRCGEDVWYENVSVKVCDEKDAQGKCVRGHVEERRERHARARSCMVTETRCIRHGTAIISKRDDMTIEFKKLQALAEGQADLYRVKGVQKAFDSDTVVYSLEAVQTVQRVKISRQKRLFGRSEDDLVVKPE